MENQEYLFEDECYYNLIGKKKSKNKNAKKYILSAHYDSMNDEENYSKLAPGADDNCSGVAILLEVANLLKDIDLDINLEFVLFNMEEEEFRGSQVFAEKYYHIGTEIAGVINLDTLGSWNGDLSKNNGINYVSIPETKNLLSKVTKNLDLPLVESPEIWEDDQASFWEFEFQAIELTENECSSFIHTKDDTMEKLNFKNMAQITVALSKMFQKF